MAISVPGVLVNIDVGDLDRAERFYCDAFGLRPGRRFGGDILELLDASSTIYLLAKPGGTAATESGQRRSYERHWTPIHLDFVVDNIDEATSAVETAGATRESDIHTHAWGRIAQFTDPWGHGFCLIEFQGRGYDEIADQDGA
ncbi:MAG: VOC family protein [Pseudomonadota bacterium]